MSSLIESLLGDIEHDTAMSPERRELLSELLARVVMIAESDADTTDLHVAVTAIDELLEAFTLFQHYRERKKLTIFGSARTRVDSPLFEMTRELARAMAERDWIVVSGAGPGIMEASSMGAGRENTLGVNIKLPFEQNANAYIDAASNLVTMKYFFTRKVALTRPSIAFVVLPGGLGTMDELFEILTLLDTGKTTPAPVVLLDRPDGKSWTQWMTFVDEAIVANDYVGQGNMCLVRFATSVTDAVDEIEHFYSNYQGFAMNGDRGVLTLRLAPTEEQLGDLRAAMPTFAAGLGFQLEGEHTISFNFDGRNFLNLRELIDRVNGWSDYSSS